MQVQLLYEKYRNFSALECSWGTRKRKCCLSQFLFCFVQMKEIQKNAQHDCFGGPSSQEQSKE